MNLIVFESKVAALDVNMNQDKGIVDHSNNHNSERCVPTANMQDDIVDSDDDMNNVDDETPHRFKIAYCVREIQNHLVIIQEKEFEHHKGGEERTGMPVTFQFDMKEMNSFLFSSILQQWSKNILHSATSDSGQICFDLPETFDGSQCAISLSLSYSILPYRLDSIISKHVIEDIKNLT